MLISLAKRVLRPIRQRIRKNPDQFLRHVTGVIHVGANTGQEREAYDRLGLQVVWIEPIPEVFAELQQNIARFPRQRALQALVTDRDDEDYTFHVSNNQGLSSSILELKQHRDIWPNVHYAYSICMKSTTLPSLLREHDVEPGDFQALIMDTQGSELLVLEGCVPILSTFKYIKTEVPDFESYAGCCTLIDIEQFMARHRFEEASRKLFASRKEGGNYFDIVYRNRSDRCRRFHAMLKPLTLR